MLFGKNRKEKISYDPSTQEPAIRKSICTGETTVGFRDLKTGHFTDIRKVNSPAETDQFCRELGISREDLKTIW